MTQGKNNPVDKNHYNIDSDEKGFAQAKAEMREKLKQELNDFNENFKKNNKKGRNQRLKTDKILKLFDVSAGESVNEKIVKRRNGTLILKDKSGNSREKIKLARGGKILKIKDRNNNEILKIDLEKDEIKRSIGDWLEDLKNEIEVPDHIYSFKQGDKGEINLSAYLPNTTQVSEYKFAGISNYELGALMNFKTGKLEFSQQAPVGTYEVYWQAKTELGWTKKSKITISVLPAGQQEVIEDDEKDEELEKEYQVALGNFREKERAVQNPTLGIPSTGVEYNLERVEGQVVAAEEAYAVALAAADKYPDADRTELNALKNDLDSKKSKLEKLQKLKQEKIAKIQDNIDAKVKEAIDNQKKEQKAQQKIAKDMEARSKKLEADIKAQETAGDFQTSFEKVRDGKFVIEKETGFIDSNLDTLGGIEVEMQKHEHAVRQFRAEMSVMNLSVKGLEQNHAKFEEEKANKTASLIGGASAGLLVGAATFTGLVAWPVVIGATAAVAGINLVKGWFSKKDKPGFAGNGSLLGMIGNGNEEAYAAQAEKLKFEQNFAELSEKLKVKEEKLHTDGEKIYAAANNPQRVLDNEANKVWEENNVKKSINDLYFEVGQSPAPAEVIQTAQDKLKDAVATGNSAKIAKLKTNSAQGQANEGDILNKENFASLEQNQRRISSVNYKAADIGDYTFGALGKFLQKGKDILVLGGIANGLGKMSEGIGSIVSHPGKFLNGVVGLVGVDTDPNSNYDKWSLDKIADSWGGLLGGIVAKDSWVKAQTPVDYVNWGTEVLTNAIVAFYSLGAGAGTRAGFVARVSKGFGRVKSAPGNLAKGVMKIGKQPLKTTLANRLKWAREKFRGGSKLEKLSVQLDETAKTMTVDGKALKIGDELSFVENGNKFQYRLRKIEGDNVWLEGETSAVKFEVKGGELSRMVKNNPKYIKELALNPAKKPWYKRIWKRKEKNPAKKRSLWERIRGKNKRLEKSVKELEESFDAAQKKGVSSEIQAAQEALTAAKTLETELINTAVSDIQKLFKERGKLENGSWKIRRPSTWGKSARAKRIAKIDGEIRGIKESAVKDALVSEKELLTKLRAEPKVGKFFDSDWKAIEKAERITNPVELNELSLGKLNLKRNGIIKNLKNGEEIKLMELEDGVLAEYKIKAIESDRLTIQKIKSRKKSGKIKELESEISFDKSKLEEMLKNGQIEF